MVDKKFLIPAIVAIVLIAAAAVVVASYSDDPSDDSFTIIHTNDSHCFYDGDGGVGFATVAALKEEYSKKTTVFTVDAGISSKATPMAQ